MPHRDTTPGPKYGPTPGYGSCEAGTCRSTARTTCATCSGHFCLRHAQHEIHERPQGSS